MEKNKKKMLKRALILSYLLLTGCSSKNTKDIPNESIKNTKIEIEQTTKESNNFETVSQNIIDDIAEVKTEEEIEEVEVRKNEHVDLLMIGDMLIHTPVYKSGIQSDGSLNYDHFFEHIQEDLNEAEIKIVNQETILGGTDMGITSYPCFNSPQEVGDSEAKAGFNVVLHATNHAMDKGYKAIENTMNFWNQKYPDMTILGLNLNEEEQNNIQIYEQNDFKIALLNYTYGTNGIPLPKDMPYLVNLLDKEKVTKDIIKAKQLADFVVVMPHWGTEYRYIPDNLQEEYTTLFSNLGVDLVIGTHPHVLENIETIVNDDGHEMLVYYSLGNFVSAQNKKDRVVGGMAKVSIEKDYETNECYITEYELDPIITQQGDYTSYKLEDYNDDLALKNRVRNYSGCSNFNMEYINDLCYEILGDTFDQSEKKVRVKVK